MIAEYVSDRELTARRREQFRRERVELIESCIERARLHLASGTLDAAKELADRELAQIVPVVRKLA